ncbi:MAG: uroporphyrinogen-III synthase [Chloroflexi bacterium]|nr:uroporphyrinogen-III synthase [Chloroflexota bacterium]
MTKLLITRPRHQSADFARLARQAGFEPVLFPTIDIRPVEDTTALERAIARLDCYDWVVFTSTNAVDAFWKRAIVATGHTENTEKKAKNAVNSVLSMVKTAAIGAKTAATLQAHGVTPDFVPERFLAEDIAPGLGDLRGRWVLIPAADIARDTLPDAVVKAGGAAHVVTVYHTLPAAPDPDGLAALREGVDWLTFTSPSTVRNFVALVTQAGLDPFHLPSAPRVACIGPVTADAAREAGFRVDAAAEPHTAEGLLAAIRHTQ